MASDTDIPCSACLSWDQKTKSFSCDPNKCEKLSYWLLKHIRDVTPGLDKPIQYVV